MLKQNCHSCSLCQNICPKDAIILKENENGFLAPMIDEEKCIHCNLCQKTCASIIDRDEKYLPNAFAGKSTDDTLRKNSSSGGIFGEIARKIIERGGVVYGAAYSSDNTVVHLRVSDVLSLRKLQGSKYVQSELGDAYRLVRNDLNSGVPVLFSGTPCQIEGLYKFLRKKYDNLYTVDIICHGVTSRKVWFDYLNYISKSKKYDISEINFRDKETGWHRFSFSYKRNGKKKSCLFIDDPFCFFFDKHFIINPACFECKFAGKPHFADITLGDLWGIQNFKNIQDDNMGTSLVIVSSKKGEEILSYINNISLIAVDAKEAIAYNLHEPPQKPSNYEDFWQAYSVQGIKKCIDLYFYGSFKRRVKWNIKILLTKTRLINFFIK